MRTQPLFVWIVVCLAAVVLLNSGGEYGDQLVMAAAQYEVREIQKLIDEFSRCTDFMQNPLGPEAEDCSVWFRGARYRMRLS